MNLDVLEVPGVDFDRLEAFTHIHGFQILSMVPPNWPLTTTSTVLSRSLRRLLHSRHEGMIIKNLSAGQNLEANLFSVSRATANQ